MSASPFVLPPVRLLPASELARIALDVPLLERAVRLARWAGPERAVDAMGELLDDELAAAAAELGLTGKEGKEGDEGEERDGLGEAAQAWAVAVDAGLLDLEIEEEAEESTPQGEAAGRAVPGAALAAVAAGEPQDVLDAWLAAAEAALAEAASPDLEPPHDADGELGAEDQDWDPEEEAAFLDTALANLYTLMALDDGTETSHGAVPLPVLAASLVVPDEMEQPSDAVLEEVTDVMMRLDEHFRLLDPTGLLAYQPLDDALIEDDEEAALPEPGEELDPQEISRYGLVRLTPLGVYGMRQLLMDAGASAPVVGELAEASGAELLSALAGYPDHVARTEAESWLADRKPADAARELLAAARGDDATAPSRRLICQQTLTLLGDEAEPALREVLDDRRLGGLARVWLTEIGAADVPAPDPDMVFWLTVDTLAAQLAAGDDPELLSELVADLVARHDGFFDAAWRVDHPATADVLEAMGRLHPDRKAAKDARKAAFKARSRDGS
ncbi:hypothetical protein [Actinacidiphila epipremni]|uniref:Uncharacterized protein n=1 Tax=Actinacidiphila epipremni TaxID=2053013 RepID=A0ABX0ZVL2_9ACTN|nr:hypothetical protein [Actinacidiphila epipremni]NJP45646.1 hypothetical protein [Actinacidiphila epipremni]